MAHSANLGFPRFGVNREWKKVSERYWAGKLTREDLLATADDLMMRHWKLQKDAGIDIIPVNDFAFYDHVLDTIALLGAVPARYNHPAGSPVDVDTYFAMGRGRQDATTDVTAMEMTKWFDTNYHYIVPELSRGMQFHVASERPFEAVEKARKAGVESPRPVLLGPVSFLLLGKAVEEGVSFQELLNRLLPVYGEILARFSKMGVQQVQIDEPTLVLDLDEEAVNLFRTAYAYFSVQEALPSLMVATYFGTIEHNLDLAVSLADGLHIDLVRAPGQLKAVAGVLTGSQTLSLGVVDGRNVWRTDLEHAFDMVKQGVELVGSDRIQIAPSCSLLHSPIDLERETKMDSEILEWLAFGKQKLDEIQALTLAANGKRDEVADFFDANAKAIRNRRSSSKVTNPAVQVRMAKLNDDMARRATPFSERIRIQQEKLHLPPYPTTTIGSFPQTKDVRKLRASLKKGEITQQQYDDAIAEVTLETIRFQEEADLDVLVHGEFERNDMVEYFGEQLDGFVFSQNGWVQSYGSRGVKPPIIFGDINRPAPMTVRWSKFAKDHTDRPMKGMLTGPVTILQWSFVRDDQPRKTTCEQISLAIRDEVVDLESAGIDVIQIDEPAIREGLPLRRQDWAEYLDWAVRCFRISASGVQDATQIHTHMCYSEFNDMIESIAAMDADVISIEASRSRMELLDSFDNFVYPNDIGPGVWDIHSPRVPSREEMVELLKAALKHVPKDRLWVNPDCGLKTRGWEETRTSVRNMVDAAKTLRERA